jgi:hypothetical protein
MTSAGSPPARQPGCFVVLGLPILVEILVVGALVATDHPYRSEVDRMLGTPAGVFSLSCTGLFAVCVVMYVVLTWFERRAGAESASSRGDDPGVSDPP